MDEKIKHALEVCERVIDHACKVGDSEWSVYSGFREAREAIKAAQQSLTPDVFTGCANCVEFEDCPFRDGYCSAWASRV